MKFIVNVSAALLLMSCGQSPSEPNGYAQNAGLQCGKDTDCKGDRVCDAGKCVSPSLSSNGPASPDLAINGQQLSAPDSTSQSTLICGPRDTRTKIPVWKPTVNEDGELSSSPPQRDGMIVYIELFEDVSKTSCKDSDLNAFSSPNEAGNPSAGGLAVNIRGNTQLTNGICYFRGYYMNEDVMGMHQGWIETYFKAVDKEKIAFSDKYCLAKSLN